MGRYIRDDGYVLLYEGGQLVYEHRAVMERRLGRVLTADEVVHHRNERKGDNDLDNLELKSRSAHARDHQSPAPQVLCSCARCGCSFLRLKHDCDEATRRGQVNLYCTRACAVASLEGRKPITHGSKSAYDYHGCRCVVCREGIARRMRAYRKRIR